MIYNQPVDKLLKLLLSAAFLNGFLWNILVPIWQYPDEQAHFAQVQHRSEYGSTPLEQIKTSREIDISESVLSTKRDGMGNNKYTYHPEFNIAYTNSIYGEYETEITNMPILERKNQVSSEATRNPPLYYLLASIPYKIFYFGDLFTRVYAVRLFSVIIYVATVYVSYKTAKIQKIQNNLAFLIAASIAFLPMFVFASTGILPDPLTNLLFTIIFLISIKLIIDGVSRRLLLLAMPVILVGLYTRQNFFLAIPIVFTGILIGSTKSWLRIMQTVAAAIVAYISLFYLDRITESTKHLNLIHIPDGIIPNPMLIFEKPFIAFVVESAKRTYAETLPWYWGVYRWLSFTLPPITYQIINRLLILAAFGVLVRFVRVIRSRKLQKSDLVLIFMIATIIEYFVIFTIWNYSFTQKNGFPFGIQGRYFFPLILPITTIIYFGLSELARLLNDYGKYFLFAILSLIIFFNDFTLAYLAASYYDTSSLNHFIIQASQYKPELIKGNIIIVFIASALISQALLLASYLRYIKKA